MWLLLRLSWSPSNASDPLDLTPGPLAASWAGEREGGWAFDENTEGDHFSYQATFPRTPDMCGPPGGQKWLWALDKSLWLSGP